MMEELANCENRIVGKKQVSRALEAGELRRVFVAQDADETIKADIIRLARAVNTQYVVIPTKRELGRLSGIHVDAACAGLRK